jgi:hypothetical protein
MADLESIHKKIISFRNERDWAQFHDPKNLAEALSIEAGELLENSHRKTTSCPPKLTAERTQEQKKNWPTSSSVTPISVGNIISIAGENGK